MRILKFTSQTVTEPWTWFLSLVTLFPPKPELGPTVLLTLRTISSYRCAAARLPLALRTERGYVVHQLTSAQLTMTSGITSAKEVTIP